MNNNNKNNNNNIKINNNNNEHDTLEIDNVSAQRFGNQALETARSSLVCLANQNEQLDSCRHYLDQEKILLNRSTRLIRGMTWSGWVYNILFDRSDHIIDLTSPPDHSDQMYNKPIQKVDPTSLPPTHLGPPQYNHHDSEQHLQILSKQLQELQTMSNSINDSIHQQNRKLDVLNIQSDSVADQSKWLVHKMTHLTSSLPPLPPIFVRNVGIQHTQTQTWIHVQNGTGTVQLTSCSPPPIFQLYTSRSSSSSTLSDSVIIGLRHTASSTWLGYSKYWGTLTCSSTTYGIRETWYMDEQEPTTTTKPTRLYLAHAHWGQGAWLQVDDDNRTHLSLSKNYQDKEKAAYFTMIDM